MKTKFVITKDAKQDLKEIFNYIARDSKKAAKEHNNKFRNLFRTIGENPQMGILKEEFGKKVRIVVMNNYLIFHRHKEITEILRIIHGYRNINSSILN